MYTELSAQLDDARETSRNAVRNRDRVAQQLIADLDAWSQELEELAREPFAELDEDIQDWAESGEGTGPAEQILHRVRETAVENLGGERLRVEALRNTAVEERDALSETAEQLRTGYHEPPAPAPTRDSRAREGRPGAPLWQCCDFREGLDDTARAGLEAALESAGLLDAWILPDGRLLDSPEADTLLALTDREVEGPNLAEYLLPALDRENPAATDLDDSVVKGLLARIGFGKDHGSVWVDPSGSWRVGPLHGYWQKDTAQHIGQGAREANRRKRLREIEAQLEIARMHIEDLDKELEVLRERRRKLDGEAANLPDHGPLRKAFADLAAAVSQIDRLTDRVANAEEQVAACRVEQQDRRNRRDSEAAVLGLENHVETLSELREHTHHYG
ncbi:MAG: hypothetical protein MI867_29095, partial [Pseudomonadales bacterium]|nr:hypothetical protein [Pseudomonadales bacterium]